ncbi:hypothetical protein DMC30DRAFT_251104 [Rhodotorula diobovata]|uniref:Uncharacterized protein n=1 Tax=Rhodotorula diobovata TaxID=5288 RepID=A0A5C5FVX8_9BASI|nr:hypothetical protein DMC30DRAFT_251104 [Rhodotorula diobovata]
MSPRVAILAVLVLFAVCSAPGAFAGAGATDPGGDPSQPGAHLAASSSEAHVPGTILPRQRARGTRAARGSPLNVSWDPLGSAEVASEAFHPLPPRPAVRRERGAAALEEAQGRGQGPQRLSPPQESGEGDEEAAEGEGEGEDEEGEGWDSEADDMVEGDMLSEEGWLRRRRVGSREVSRVGLD